MALKNGRNMTKKETAHTAKTAAVQKNGMSTIPKETKSMKNGALIILNTGLRTTQNTTKSTANILPAHNIGTNTSSIRPEKLK